MKILVAVKRVVDAKIKVRPLPDHSGVDVKLAKMAMNPFDEIAIEKAVTLREAGVADEVVAVTVGPLKAVDTLRVAMAIGADRAVHVRTDESLEPLAVAKVLRAVVEREKPDLVLLGKQAIDDDANQTGQMLSALCDMPLATFANEIVLEGGRWVVTRETDGGTQTVSLATPAVVTADLRLSASASPWAARSCASPPSFSSTNRSRTSTQSCACRHACRSRSCTVVSRRRVFTSLTIRSRP